MWKKLCFWAIYDGHEGLNVGLGNLITNLDTTVLVGSSVHMCVQVQIWEMSKQPAYITVFELTVIRI